MKTWCTIVVILLVVLLLSLLTGKTVFAQTAPTVETNPAGNVTSDSATLNGNLTDLGTASSVDVSFVWGTTPGGPYDNETTATPPTMTAAGTFSASLSGILLPGTTYYFEAKADGGGNGTNYGAEENFTTGTPTPPAVETNPAGNITSDSATLSGYLTSMGDASTVDVSFEWGNDTGYGNEIPAGSMNDVGPFSADLSSLDPGTTYYFRAKAVGNGTATGADLDFTTALPFNLEGWGWCTNYNQVVAITFDGYTTMVERANAPSSHSMHTVGNLTLPAPYNETISLDMYGNRARLVFYLRQEATGKSVNFEGTWIVNAAGNETYIGMAGWVALPNSGGEALKTTRICFVVLRTPSVDVPVTQPGSFTQDLDSMLTRFVKLIDSTLTGLTGTGFAGILSSILGKIAVLFAHLRALGTPYIA
jgi:hypothetical protein